MPIKLMILFTWALVFGGAPQPQPMSSVTPLVFYSPDYDCSNLMQVTGHDTWEPFAWTDPGNPHWPTAKDSAGNDVGCVLLKHPTPGQGGSVRFGFQALNVHVPAITVNSNISSNYTPKRKGDKIEFEDDDEFDFVVSAPEYSTGRIAKVRVVYEP